MLRIITDAQRYVPYAVMKWDLQVLLVRQEVRNYSVTYRQKLQCHLPTETTVSPTDRNYSVTYRQKLQCHLPTETTVSPTNKGLTITPTAWKTLYFKEQITIVGLSGITPQI